MKELTIEEKAKAYDEAKSIMGKYLKSGNAGVIAENTIKKAFPELGESEDEMIRKELIEKVKETPALKLFKDEDVCKFMQYIEKEAKAYDFNLPNRSYDIYAFAKDILAWLEKQCEKLDEWKEGDIVRHGGILALVIKGRRAMKQNGEQIIIQYPDEWVKANSKERKYFFEELEKQKVTKQYKVGDKVTFDGIEGYVLEVDDAGEPTVLCSEILGDLTWDDAMEKANQDLWHLPTADEFKKYHQIVRELDNNKWIYYWTSTEYGSVCARHVDTSNGNVTYSTKILSFYVRAFAYVGSKKESKPRSWEEYCKQVKNTRCYICVQDSVIPYKRRVTRPQYNEFDTEEEAKAFIALGKLLKIHKAWVKNWRPDWTGGRLKYNIQPHNNEIIPIVSTASSRVLTFPTAEMRDEFLETFRDLIEEAKPLL